MITKPAENVSESGPPPGAALGYPLKPIWIHDVLNLWQRNWPITALREQAMERAAQEVRSPVARRKSINTIFCYFMPTKGSGRRQRTLSPNVWSAYSQLYAVPTLAPVYLAHLCGESDLARVATRFISMHYAQGDDVELTDIRRHLIKEFGDHRCVCDGASAYLRTLGYFGVFVREGRLGNYRYARRLTVERAVFPLLVWSWWQRYPQPQIDLDHFAGEVKMDYLDQGSFAEHWGAYENRLWTRNSQDSCCVLLRSTDGAGLARALLNLLSAHPKWRLVKKEFQELDWDEEDGLSQSIRFWYYNRK